MESYEIKTDLKHKTLIQIPAAATRAHDQSPSPAPRRRLFYASTGDLSGGAAADEEQRQACANPRSTQRGLLRVVSGSADSPSKIPRRKSITASQETLMIVGGLRTKIPTVVPRRTSISPASRRGSNVGRRPSIHHPGQPQHSAIDLGIVANSKSSSGGGSSSSKLRGHHYSHVSRSNSRISKPTTLSPIIGTPNKDSEQEDSGSPKHQSNMTKIPIRHRNGAGVASGQNRASSTVNSRTNSREPSPGTTLKPGTGSKPVSRSSSNRSTSSVRGTAAAPKGGISGNNAARSSMRKGGTAAKTSTAAGSKSTTKSSGTTAKTDSMKRNTTSKRDLSGSGSLQRSTSNLRREKTTMKQSDGRSKGNEHQKSAAQLKRENSKLNLPTPLTKNNSDSQLNKPKLDRTDSFRQEKPSDTTNVDDKTPKTDTSAATAPAAAATAASKPSKPTAVIEKRDSGEKLVPMTKPNVVSMTTAAITSQPLEITTAVANSNSGSSNTSETDLAAAKSKSTIQPLLQSPGHMLEQSQKTLECIQQTMKDATGEITRAIEGNLSDLKALENDFRTGAEPGSTANTLKKPAMLEKNTSTRSLVKNTNDAAAKAASTAAAAAGEAGAKDRAVLGEAQGVEAKVSVVRTSDNVNGGAGDAGATTNGSSESAAAAMTKLTTG